MEASELVQPRASKRQACGEDIVATVQSLGDSLCGKNLEHRDALDLGDNRNSVWVDSGDCPTEQQKLMLLQEVEVDAHGHHVSLIAHQCASQRCRVGEASFQTRRSWRLERSTELDRVSDPGDMASIELAREDFGRVTYPAAAHDRPKRARSRRECQKPPPSRRICLSARGALVVVMTEADSEDDIGQVGVRR